MYQKLVVIINIFLSTKNISYYIYQKLKDVSNFLSIKNINNNVYKTIKKICKYLFSNLKYK